LLEQWPVKSEFPEAVFMSDVVLRSTDDSWWGLLRGGQAPNCEKPFFPAVAGGPVDQLAAAA
jgi:hypothetical protein